MSVHSISFNLFLQFGKFMLGYFSSIGGLLHVAFRPGEMFQCRSRIVVRVQRGSDAHSLHSNFKDAGLGLSVSEK